MTEYDLFVEHIPMIAEMIVICSEMDDERYLEWENETLDTAPQAAKSFIKKVLTVISKNRAKRRAK